MAHPRITQKTSSKTALVSLVLVLLFVFLGFSSFRANGQNTMNPMNAMEPMSATPDLGSGMVPCSKIPGANAREIYTDEAEARAVTVVVSTGEDCWGFLLKNTEADESGQLQGTFVGNPTHPGTENHARTIRNVRNLYLICDGETDVPDYCSYRIVGVDP